MHLDELRDADDREDRAIDPLATSHHHRLFTVERCMDGHTRAPQYYQSIRYSKAMFYIQVFQGRSQDWSGGGGGGGPKVANVSVAGRV